MGWDAGLTLAVVGCVIGLLIFTRIASDVLMIAGVTVLMLAGVLTRDQALSGLANEGMVTVGVLYIVVAGLESTGATAWLAHHLLGHPKSLLRAQLRMMGQVTAVSGFLNNTPVVAMFVPAVRDWAKRHRLSVSKLLIPLSYASILGGMCTLIGTSTNLVVNGLVMQSGRPGLGMWDITWVGLPAAFIGILYLALVSRWLLPDRKPVIGPLSDPREYTIEMLVEPNSSLTGKTIEQAGLRHLTNMFVAEIDRNGEILAAVAPRERLQGGDRLLFVGVVDSVIDLQKIRGLVPATDQVFKIDAPRSQRMLVEAVVSSSCALVGKTIRDGRFRTIYNAVVIAVARNGERIRKKIGDIILMPGDTLLVEALPGFVEQQRNSRDFFLVSSVPGSTPIRHDRASIAVGILAAMVALVTLEWLTMLEAAMLAAGLMLAMRCCRIGEARRAVDWQILLTIAAALALGRALETTGTATFLANELIAMANEDPLWTLVAIYGITMLTTELITNNGAAALIFPIAMATAETLNANPMPYTIAIMLAASASFATPIGYQTNLMVYNAGGYRFSDYLRIGLPLNLLMWVLASVIIPLIYPL
ncbi:MAG: SLC13 family permease [Gammaproteobacteria bacterium]|jgi:di/tricarboxylate transporter